MFGLRTFLQIFKGAFQKWLCEWGDARASQSFPLGYVIKNLWHLVLGWGLHYIRCRVALVWLIGVFESFFLIFGAMLRSSYPDTQPTNKLPFHRWFDKKLVICCIKWQKVYFLANLYVMVNWILQTVLILLGLNNSNLDY